MVITKGLMEQTIVPIQTMHVATLYISNEVLNYEGIIYYDTIIYSVNQDTTLHSM